MTPYEKRQTVQVLYNRFSTEEYKSSAFWTVDSNFTPTYDVQIKTFEESVKPEPKEFILTTLKQIGADKRSRTADT